MRQIIYAWDYIDWGGAQIYYFALMREAKKKYLVTAVVPENSSPRIFDYFKQLDINYELLPARQNLQRASGLTEKVRLHWQKLAYENLLLKHLAAKPDLSECIVHIDMGFWQSLSTLVRLSRRTNVFVTVHTALATGRTIRSLLWRTKGLIVSQFKAVRIIASNGDAKSSLFSHLTKKKWNSVNIAYSGFNAEEIESISSGGSDRHSICRKYGLPEDRDLVFTVGQFIERKGCWTVLEGLRLLRDQFPSVFFVWIGTSPLSTETIQQIDAFGLQDNFRFMSSVEVGPKREDVLGLVNVADLFVLASFQEGLPIALIEAMALGKPCIATNVNAIPEAIDNDKNGLLVAPGEPQQLADAIVRLLENDELKGRLGTEARKSVFAEFDDKTAADVTLNMYDEVFK